MEDLRVRPNGLAAGAMPRDVGKETVCAVSACGDTLDRVGSRDPIWGWTDEQIPKSHHSRHRHAHLLHWHNDKTQDPLVVL